MKKLDKKPCEFCNELFQPRLSKQRFCSISCSSNRQPKGKDSPCWKGGTHNRTVGQERFHAYGYIEVWTGEKWTGKHRLIMSEYLGRKLEFTEHVHHINGIPNDNRIENLVVLTRSKHNSLHKKEQIKNFKRNKLGRFIE